MALMMSKRAATALPCSVAAEGSRSTRMSALMATARRARRQRGGRHSVGGTRCKAAAACLQR